MNIDEFRVFIRNKENKVEELKKTEVIDQLDLSKEEFIKVLSEELTDEEKFIISIDYLSYSYTSKLIPSINSYEIKLRIINILDMPGYYLVDAIQGCSDEDKYKLLQEYKIRNHKDISKYNIRDIIRGMTDKWKKKIIYSQDFNEWYSNFDENDYYEIIKSMTSNDEITAILEDEKFITDKLSGYYISELLPRVQNEDKRYQLGIKYNLNISALERVIASCSDDKKTEILLSEENKFGYTGIESILASFEINNLFNFLQQHSDFIQKYKVHIYVIVRLLSEEKQLQFVSMMDENNIELDEKLKSLVVLNKEVKAKIDRSTMSKDYINALEMSVIDFEDTSKDKTLYVHDIGHIKIDLEGDLARYKGLDELINIRPQNIPFEEYDKLFELCKICPNMQVADNLNLQDSTVTEFLMAEEWIKDVLENIQEDWSDLQKAAYIDYRIGKKISYTPDFDTEVSDIGSARALWRIIVSGYGVCNGIAQIEQYMLKRVGIESEMVSAKTHAFLKVKDIEIPREDGTIIKGDTIFDPTWNLTAHRYNCKPNHFARSYEEIRKFDILKDGTDRCCHKNDQAFRQETIDIEESVLRQVYKSIGLTKENGHFPVEDMSEESDKIAKRDLSLEQKIEKQLELLRKINPAFDKCQNSTMGILSSILLNHPEMEFDRCVINRVYNKSDERKTPSVYVYCNLEGGNEVFFVAEPGNGAFVRMSKEEFCQNYDCYEMDIEKLDGVRPWEKNAKEIEEDLNKSSGKVVANETQGGDDR